MKTDIRKPQAPESYATFWESIASEPAAPVATATANSADARDAYSEFVNVTEGAPEPVHASRN